MSIASELTRLQQAKIALRRALVKKGYNIPLDSTIDTWPNYIIHDYSQDYLTFVMLEDGGSFGYYDSTPREMYFSKDGGQTWVLDTEVDNAQTIFSNLLIGDKILVKGNVDDAFYTESSRVFYIPVNYSVEGNTMSMFDSEGFRTRTTFPNSSVSLSQFFVDDTKLISAENLVLPALTLTSACYFWMFSNCTSLTTAPELPATTLANDCYFRMFSYCTSLTAAPELPAIELAENCYDGMFSGCSSLASAPLELPATELANYCYNGMFGYCSLLTRAPELPAETLVDGCYQCMFQGCTNLNYVKCLATDISASSCTSEWLDYVSSTGTFIKNELTDWSEKSSGDGIPEGWTVQNA